MFNLFPQNYRWCIECERAYSKNEAIQADDGQKCCAYSDCSALAEESWEWSRLRQDNLYYPKTPDKGIVYRVFPPKLQHAM